MTDKFIVGIDPDLTKSGVATGRNGKVEALYCLTMTELVKFFNDYKYSIKKVYLEAGWLNTKTSWHAQNSKSRGVAERTAYHVGQNHAVGMLIEQALIDLEINYVLIKPWESKRNHEQFVRYTGWKGGRTNPETRDAGCLIYGHY